jgi:putative phage repressor
MFFSLARAQLHAQVCVPEPLRMSTIAERLLLLRGKTKQGEFANSLGINPNTLRSYENGRTSPNHEFLEQICVQFSVSPEWLLLGHGPIRPEDSETPQNELPQPMPHDEALRRLEARLDASENERRELGIENRQLHRDKAELLRENGELREKLARLEERKHRHDLTHGLPAEDSGVA